MLGLLGRYITKKMAPIIYTDSRKKKFNTFTESETHLKINDIKVIIVN